MSRKKKDEQDIVLSGISIKTGPHKKEDLLELTDAEFLSVLFNTLSTFRFEGHPIGPETINRLLRNYVLATMHHPERKPAVRLGAILCLEAMGKCFVKDETKWRKCIEYYNPKQQNITGQSDD